MHNQRCQNNNGKTHKTSIPSEISEPLDDQARTDENTSNTTPPEPIAQAVFDRINVRLQQEQSDIVPDRQHLLLEKLGHQLRQWRIKQGYPRQELADKLGLDVNRLLAIEHGIGSTKDITVVQLHTLTTLLTEDELDRGLNGLLEHYLASFKP